MKTTSIFSTVLVILVIIVAGGIIYFANRDDSGQVCTMDVQLCSDGSYVSRTGPNCEFAPCPGVTSTSTVTTKIGQMVTLNDVSITPIQVLGDSRCAAGTQCIWPGTVDLRVTLEMEGESETEDLSLDDEIEFNGKIVSFISVTPGRTTNQSISTSSYNFTFSVEDEE